MNLTGIRLVRNLVTAVLAAAVVSALVLQPGGSGGATSLNPQPTSLSDAQLAASAASDIFLDVSGFTGGESLDETYNHMSTATGVTSAITRAANGKSVPEPIVITKPLDSFTTQFSNAVSTGVHLQAVHLYFRKSGTHPITFMTYDLSNVIVTRDAPSVGDATDAVEKVRLTPAKFKITYVTQDAEGGVENTFIYCWDFVRNVSCVPNNP